MTQQSTSCGGRHTMDSCKQEHLVMHESAPIAFPRIYQRLLRKSPKLYISVLNTVPATVCILCSKGYCPLTSTRGYNGNHDIVIPKGHCFRNHACDCTNDGNTQIGAYCTAKGCHSNHQGRDKTRRTSRNTGSTMNLDLRIDSRTHPGCHGIRIRQAQYTISCNRQGKYTCHYQDSHQKIKCAGQYPVLKFIWTQQRMKLLAIPCIVQKSNVND